MNLRPDTLAVDGSLLERTLASAVKDRQMVTPEGKSVAGSVEGVSIRDLTTHTDDRGTVIELYDPRWEWHPDPLVFAYCFTLRPGYAKGWNLHQLHEDRYCLLQGEMELVLYDVRPGSSTCGLVSRVVLSEHHRRLVNVPKFVWHADVNIGQRDCVVVNFPTTPYDHVSPDKYRLPLDTPLIPYSLAGYRGF
ncbi:MAG: dTDP-4-dehydrorhamnose 3,5-epimerase [Methyloceanibacter sp.]